MNGAILRVIVLLVEDPRSSRHDLNLSRMDHPCIPLVVLVLQFLFQDIGHNLHIPMGVRSETLTGLDNVLIEDPQDPPQFVFAGS